MEPIEGGVPEAPEVTSATIVREPESGRECLLATTGTGEHLAFAFETDSTSPGLALVDARQWLDAAADGAEESSDAAFEAVDDPRADEWLQPLMAHPVGAEWLGHVKEAHPDAFHHWFSQEEYDEGGEEGAG